MNELERAGLLTPDMVRGDGGSAVDKSPASPTANENVPGLGELDARLALGAQDDRSRVPLEQERDGDSDKENEPAYV